MCARAKGWQRFLVCFVDNRKGMEANVCVRERVCSSFQRDDLNRLVTISLYRFPIPNTTGKFNLALFPRKSAMAETRPEILEIPLMASAADQRRGRGAAFLSLTPTSPRMQMATRAALDKGESAGKQ